MEETLASIRGAGDAKHSVLASRRKKRLRSRKDLSEKRMGRGGCKTRRWKQYTGKAVKAVAGNA